MPVKFENLVELCERSCRSSPARPLFGVKKAGRLDVDHLRRVRRAGRRVPRRPREPRRRARRRGRDHRQQPRRVGRRVLRHLRARRRVVPDVRGAARQGVGSSSSTTAAPRSRIGADRRRSSSQLRRMRAEQVPTLAARDRPRAARRPTTTPYEALLEAARKRPVPAVSPRPRTSPASSTPRAPPATRRA